MLNTLIIIGSTIKRVLICSMTLLKEYFSKSHNLFCSDYLPVIQLKETIREYNKNSDDPASIQLDLLQSFSKKNVKLAHGKYPVIFFASGYGVSAQMYENILLL